MIIVTRYLSKSSLPFAVQGLQHFLITSLCAGIGSLRQPLPNFCSGSEDLQSFSWIFPLPEMISYCGTLSFVFSPASENHRPSSVMLGIMQWFLKILTGDSWDLLCSGGGISAVLAPPGFLLSLAPRSTCAAAPLGVWRWKKS